MSTFQKLPLQGPRAPKIQDWGNNLYINTNLKLFSYGSRGALPYRTTRNLSGTHAAPLDCLFKSPIY